uniref:BTB domain-containing protein n=1 Tax=Arcella intermedia TaxID=1963864 RepID=A0A6B2LEJ6_9EUKA
MITYTSNQFPQEYIPTVFDNYTALVKIGDKISVNLGLWDTSGREGYARLRPLSYPKTDVFLVGFSVVNPYSFESVATTWVPEVRHHMPHTPIVIAGFQIDLREDKEYLSKYSKKSLPITTAQGEKLAEELGAYAYMEFSSLTQYHLKDTFDMCIKIAIMPPSRFPPTLPHKPDEPELYTLFSSYYANSALSSALQNFKKLSGIGDLELVGKDKSFFVHKINLVCGSKVFYDYFINGRGRHF